MKTNGNEQKIDVIISVDAGGTVQDIRYGPKPKRCLYR